MVRERQSFSWGSRLVVLCQEGFVLSGNNTRQCVEAGQWTGPPPSCEPILCHHPPAVVNGLVQLLNGSTIWQASLTPWPWVYILPNAQGGGGLRARH